MKATEVLVEDFVIRKFIKGAFPEMLMSDVVIKRRHNLIITAFIVYCNPMLPARERQRIHFLTGFGQEILTRWLKRPVTLEIQTVSSKQANVYKTVLPKYQ